MISRSSSVISVLILDIIIVIITMIFLAFTLYLILFTVVTFGLGFNSVRVAVKTKSNPKVFTLLLPTLINVF